MLLSLQGLSSLVVLMYCVLLLLLLALLRLRL